MSVQSMEAGIKGREVRERRSEFKRELKDRRARLSTLLREGIPDWLTSIDAERLLCMAPRVGHRACHSLLREAHLGPAQEAGHITTRQRLLLADELEKIEALPSNVRRAAQ